MPASGEFGLVVDKGRVLVSLARPQSRRGHLGAEGGIVLGDPAVLVSSKCISAQVRVL